MAVLDNNIKEVDIGLGPRGNQCPPSSSEGSGVRTGSGIRRTYRDSETDTRLVTPFARGLKKSRPQPSTRVSSPAQRSAAVARALEPTADNSRRLHSPLGPTTARRGPATTGTRRDSQGLILELAA